MNLTQVVDTALKSFRHEIPEYVASGIVDMSTGMLLDADTVDEHPREILDVLAAATADLFQGRTVTQVEHMWRERRGLEPGAHHYFQEILVNSDSLIHLFLRSRHSPDIVAAVVCRLEANLGMLLAQARQVMRELDGAR
ncbi:hypothetical protein GCM10009836_11000 [Pseudonocardia ailaonensis]|uniref:Roadblock/LAMTOR2 domain-containing protein n=1 Tax=Pseudonocardia ailaonensis TaxID=367279 RepID=A0ABN2MPR0_9PSEU